ncbi:unnamed protein product [Spodoptera exigua]|nr:unnamed protein product [Spodoptera exigua]
MRLLDCIQDMPGTHNEINLDKVPKRPNDMIARLARWLGNVTQLRHVAQPSPALVTTLCVILKLLFRVWTPAIMEELRVSRGCGLSAMSHRGLDPELEKERGF